MAPALEAPAIVRPDRASHAEGIAHVEYLLARLSEDEAGAKAALKDIAREMPPHFLAQLSTTHPELYAQLEAHTGFIRIF